MSEETTKKVVKKETAKKSMDYADVLEARAQRGQMTHQKLFAIQNAKEKQNRGE